MIKEELRIPIYLNYEKVESSLIKSFKINSLVEHIDKDFKKRVKIENLSSDSNYDFSLNFISTLKSYQNLYSCCHLEMCMELQKMGLEYFPITLFKLFQSFKSQMTIFLKFHCNFFLKARIYGTDGFSKNKSIIFNKPKESMEEQVKDFVEYLKLTRNLTKSQINGLSGDKYAKLEKAKFLLEQEGYELERMINDFGKGIDEIQILLNSNEAVKKAGSSGVNAILEKILKSLKKEDQFVNYDSLLKAVDSQFDKYFVEGTKTKEFIHDLTRRILIKVENKQIERRKIDSKKIINIKDNVDLRLFDDKMVQTEEKLTKRESLMIERMRNKEQEFEFEEKILNKVKESLRNEEQKNKDLIFMNNDLSKQLDNQDLKLLKKKEKIRNLRALVQELQEKINEFTEKEIKLMTSLRTKERELQAKSDEFRKAEGNYVQKIKETNDVITSQEDKIKKLEEEVTTLNVKIDFINLNEQKEKEEVLLKEESLKEESLKEEYIKLSSLSKSKQSMPSLKSIKSRRKSSILQIEIEPRKKIPSSIFLRKNSTKSAMVATSIQKIEEIKEPQEVKENLIESLPDLDKAVSSISSFLSLDFDVYFRDLRKKFKFINMRRKNRIKSLYEFNNIIDNNLKTCDSHLDVEQENILLREIIKQKKVKYLFSQHILPKDKQTAKKLEIILDIFEKNKRNAAFFNFLLIYLEKNELPIMSVFESTQTYEKKANRQVQTENSNQNNDKEIELMKMMEQLKNSQSNYAVKKKYTIQKKNDNSEQTEKNVPVLPPDYRDETNNIYVKEGESDRKVIGSNDELSIEYQINELKNGSDIKNLRKHEKKTTLLLENNEDSLENVKSQSITRLPKFSYEKNQTKHVYNQSLTTMDSMMKKKISPNNANEINEITLNDESEENVKRVYERMKQLKEKDSKNYSKIKTLFNYPFRSVTDIIHSKNKNLNINNLKNNEIEIDGELSYDHFQEFFRQILKIHKKCGDNCKHLKRFYERLGILNLDSSKKELLLTKKIINKLPNIFT